MCPTINESTDLRLLTGEEIDSVAGGVPPPILRVSGSVDNQSFSFGYTSPAPSSGSKIASNASVTWSATYGSGSETVISTAAATNGGSAYITTTFL